MDLRNSAITVRVVMKPLPESARRLANMSSNAGRMVLRPRTVPQDLVSLMHHSAIFVDGELYEFTLELEKKNWPQSWVYTSTKSLAVFQKWAIEQDKFCKSAYRVADKNCHDFVTDACNFLEVPVPSKVREIVSKCRDPKYRRLIRLGGASTSILSI